MRVSTPPPPMRPFGQTGARFSELGFGCASYWAMPQFSEHTAIGLVHAALDAGVTVFDTGPSYADGLAESRLGLALRGRDHASLLLSTKAGTRLLGGRPVKDFSAGAIRESVEQSRQRLRLDCLPLLYLHGCPLNQLDASLRDTLLALRDSGKVRWLGMNSFDPSTLRGIVDDPLFDVVMMEYNLLRPQLAPLVRDLHDAGKAVVAATGLARGLYGLNPFAIRGRRDLWYWLRAFATSRADLFSAQRLRFLNRVPDWSAAQLALRHVLDNPHVSCTMFNTTRLAHLQENLQVSSRSLPESVRLRLPV